MATSNLKPSTKRSLTVYQEMVDAIRELDELDGPVLTERPKGGFTVREYATEKCLPVDTAAAKIRRWLRDGLIESVKVMLPNAAHRMMPTNVYVRKLKAK